MSVKKQIPSLCKLYSFYEEMPEEFSDETEVNSYFYHNIFYISESQHRIVRVSKGSNIKSFAIKLSKFVICRRNSFISSERWIFPKKDSVLLSAACAIFSKFLLKRASVYRFHKPNPKLGLNLQSQSTLSLLIAIKISLNIQINKFVYRSDFKTRILASFHKKSLTYMVINSHLQKSSALSITNFTTYSRTDITLHSRVKQLRINTCSTFDPDCCYDNSIIEFIGNVRCPLKTRSGKLCLHKKTFNDLGRTDYQYRKFASTCQVRNVPFENQTNSFPLLCGLVIYVFEETQKSIEDSSGDLYNTVFD